jgi:hypothetical protein
MVRRPRGESETRPADPINRRKLAVHSTRGVPETAQQEVFI